MDHRTPQRTCVGCRQKGDRAALVRLVRGPDGLALDVRGAATGRGAWLHPRRGCLEAASRAGAFARALRCAPADLASHEDTNQRLWATLSALGTRGG